MKKNVVQDVIPPKKSIRNVKISGRSGSVGNDRPINLVKDIQEPVIDKTKRPVIKPIKAPTPEPRIEHVETPVTKVAPPVYSYDYQYEEPKKPNKKWLYISLTAFAFVGIFAVSAMFKSAEIKVTPKQEQKSVNDTFTARKDFTGTGLGFQTVTVTKDVEKKVTATAEEEVERKAKGRIIIYNNYSTQSQKLVATTRFETPEGLIFRLVSAVTVPGRITKDGKTVAGSIEVEVEADKPGSNYNIGLKDFTIPGFKGDPRFSSIYGRSKTEMSGGLSGKQKVVPEDIVQASNAEMESALKGALTKDITAQIPSNFVLYSTSLSYKFDPIVQGSFETGSNEAILKKKGTATAIIIEKSALTRAVLAKSYPEISDESVKISNLEDLEFTYVTPVSDIGTVTDVSFKLNGTAEIVWLYDENGLKSDLLGLSKREASTVIGTYGTIKEAWVETRPFWSQRIPSNPENVTLINTSE